MLSSESEIAEDFYLENFRVLSNVLFALCMFSSVLKIEFTADNLTDLQLRKVLAQNFSAFLNFIVAFIFLAMYWVKFIGRLRHTAISNTPLLVIWLVYLAVLCVYPFAENLLGTYPGSPIAQITFSSLWALIGTIGLLSWWYATQSNLIEPGMSEAQAKRILYESVPEPLLALISIPFALVSDWAFYGVLLLTVPANYLIARRPPDE